MRCSHKTSRQGRGFTLIETTIAGFALAVLTVGVMNIMAISGADAHRTVLREKAIWMLNGQMERLVALHQFTDFGVAGSETSTGYGYPAVYSDNRRIFGVLTDASMAPPGTPELQKLAVGEENGILEAALTFGAKEGYPVLYVGTTAANKRNYVWVDRERSILGRLSWEQTDFIVNACDANNQPANDNKPCLCFDYGGGGLLSEADPCREIQLALEFPFRWDDATATVVDFADDKEILTLRTIVGRRL